MGVVEEACIDLGLGKRGSEAERTVGRRDRDRERQDVRSIGIRELQPGIIDCSRRGLVHDQPRVHVQNGRAVR